MRAVVAAVLLALSGGADPPGAGGPAPPADARGAHAKLRAAGDLAFQQRDDPARLVEAIAAYREAARLPGDDAGALLALARAEAFRARAAPGDAREAWHEASSAAERALRVLAPPFAEAVARGEDPSRAAARVEAPAAEALYWLALATMGGAQARGMAAALAVKDAARAMMERAAALDERVDFGGPRRALGAWLATLPSAAGGGAARAREQLDRARTLAPAYQLTDVVDARVLAVLLQDRARFDALLARVLAFDDASAPEMGPENRLAKAQARALVARRDRLF